MKNIILTAICALTTTLLASAQNSTPLLEHYRSMALGYNHDLKSAERNISASMELEKMARADLKPKVSGGANFQYTGFGRELSLQLPSLESPMNFKGPNMNYGAAVSILQPVYTGGRVIEAIRMAEHRQTLSAAGADLVRSSICFQTDIQYWNTVAKAEMVSIAADFRNSIASLVGIIDERVAVGLVDPRDLLMAQVKLNEAEYQLLESRSTLQTGCMALNSLIGVELQSATPIDSIVPTLSAVDTVVTTTNGGADRAELTISRQQIKMAETSLKLNDAKYKPQLYVGADGTYSSPGYNFKADLNPNYAVYAKLSVPIFEWGKRRSEKRMSTQQIGIANDGLNRTTDQVNLEVQSAQVALRQALERVALAHSSLEKARENERMALERYREGKSSILEVIDSQIYRQQSQINYAAGKLAAQSYRSELTRALNGYGY